MKGMSVIIYQFPFASKGHTLRMKTIYHVNGRRESVICDADTINDLLKLQSSAGLLCA